MNPQKATGSDGIPLLMFTKFSSILTSTTTYLVNETFSRVTVPQAFKQAVVCPMFKKGEMNVSTSSSNYRPVSLLSSFCKILERVVLCKLQNFISKSDPPILLKKLPTAVAIPAKTPSVKTLTIGMWRWMQGRWHWEF